LFKGFGRRDSRLGHFIALVTDAKTILSLCAKGAMVVLDQFRPWY